MSTQNGKLSLVAAFDEICQYQSVLSKGCEPEFLKFVKSQDLCRNQWLSASQERHHLQELVTKATAEKDGLDVKLKHARNQVDIEMKRRTKAENKTDELDQQIMLIRELLADNKMNQLSEKDRESLAFLNGREQQNGTTPIKPRLSAVHELSADLLSPSDVSYDHTEDDLDVSYLRGGKTWKRAAQQALPQDDGFHRMKRPTAPPLEDDTPPKRVKMSQCVTSPRHQTNNTSIVTTTVTIPTDGQITADTQFETVPRLDRSFSRPPGPKARSRPSKEHLKNQTSNETDDSFWALPENQHLKDAIQTAAVNMRPRPAPPAAARNTPKERRHTFCTKTVIKPESCKPCGKKIKFGKYAVKCKDCRMVCHPDCQTSAPLPCQPVSTTPNKNRPEILLTKIAPTTSPMVPAIVVQCINEIEQRGMNEEGLYRHSGSERIVKELKERVLLGKELHFEKINDIHVVTGLLKDILRSLSEPLLTYKLHETFMRAACLSDPDDSTTFTYQAISELPPANRDTLAYVMLHLQRVSETPVCKMDKCNLANVLGPTIVGYGVPDPEPMQMLSDTRTQPAVVDRLISIPTDFWNAFVNVDVENTMSGDVNVITNRHYGTPELPRPIPPDRFIVGPLQTPVSMAKKYSFRRIEGSRLGPIGTPQTIGSMGKKTPSSSSISKAKAIFSKAPHTPMFGSKSEKPKKLNSHFFPSPTLR